MFQGSSGFLNTADEVTSFTVEAIEERLQCQGVELAVACRMLVRSNAFRSGLSYA